MVYYCSNCKIHFQRESEFCVECGMKLKVERVSLDLSKKEVSVENETVEEVLLENDLPEVVPIEIEQPDDISVESEIINEIPADSEHELSGEVLNEILTKNNLPKTVLIMGIFAVLIILWSFLWWVIIRDGNPNLVKDLDILILFCSPSFIIGMGAIIIGNKDLARMRVVNFEKRNLITDITGLILSAGSIGMIISLIILRWILFLKT